ncbi:MAG: 2-hydroxychromene-2-carboxylate isomerase [Rhodospirillaceae bacterium]|nr:MAG: 2-hydroxychromene-2-carboxylate isomerase [Rhodospirillaceae bacterium]
MTPLRFYFDFTSTFSYITVHRVDEVAARHGRTVDWRAISLGHLFKAQGITPPPLIPAKFKYLVLDFKRSCAREGLPCKMPDPFPPDVRLARQMFWRLKAKDEGFSHLYAKAIMSALFGRGESVASVGDIVKACRALPGLNLDDIKAAADDPAAKAAVVNVLEDAKTDGMIGAPFVVLDGEPFWGADRLGELEHRLAAVRETA